MILPNVDSLIIAEEKIVDYLLNPEHPDGAPKAQLSNVGAPWAICISPGSHQFLYASNSNDPRTMDNGEIYKMELDGRIVGKFGRAGKLMKEFGTVNEIDCRNPNEIYTAEISAWRAQKILLHPLQRTATGGSK